MQRLFLTLSKSHFKMYMHLDVRSYRRFCDISYSAFVKHVRINAVGCFAVFINARHHLSSKMNREGS